MYVYMLPSSGEKHFPHHNKDFHYKISLQLLSNKLRHSKKLLSKFDKDQNIKQVPGHIC